MHHQWQLQTRGYGVRSGARIYTCPRCGATVTILDTLGVSGKAAIRKAAKSQGIDLDCSVYRVRGVMES